MHGARDGGRWWNLWRRPAAAPVPRQREGRLLDLGEEAARRRFMDHYAAVMGLDGPPSSWGAESYPDPRDWAELLLPSFRGSPRGDGPPRVDVVVAAQGNLDSLRLGLWALLGKTGRPFHLIVAHCSRDRMVRAFLRQFVALHPYVTLVEHPDAKARWGSLRRWKAERAGIEASGGDVLILLEAGAVVSHGWLDGLVDCLEEEPSCGMAGPLADVAVGRQSFPQPDALGAANRLPPWLTADGMALLLRSRPPIRPSVDFLDRVCRAVRREVIDTIGHPGGDDDFCERSRAAGFGLALADDSYVQRRPEAEPPATRDRREGAGDPLEDLRRRVRPALDTPEATREVVRQARPRPLRVAFVMPNMAHGGSGGLHSVYQEASGMRELGVDAVVLAHQSYLENARRAYRNADAVFEAYDTDDDLERLSRGREVLIATHFMSVRSVAAVWDQRQDFLPVYYVQDYEPFFSVNVNGGAPASLEARSSYDLIPGMLLFAKTHWICNATGRVRRLPVAKVEPSIDETLFTATTGCLGPSGPVRVLGMVRPRTWRRQPFATLTLLDRLKQDLGDAVEVHSFGCTDEALELMMGDRTHGVQHHGVLTREAIAALLHETDVFVDLSAFQGMGRTGFEGMCCGCTPVLPIIGGTHEYAVDGHNATLVDTSDLQACYRAVRRLVLDRDRIARLQAAGARDGQRRSILAAALSEYALIDYERARRFGRAVPHANWTELPAVRS
jgi:hypothetical protein